MGGTLKSRMSARKENTQYEVITIILKFYVDSFSIGLPLTKYEAIFVPLKLKIPLKFKCDAKSGTFGLPRMRTVMPLKTAPTYVISHITTAS